MQGCQCNTPLSPQLLLLASKIARRSAISTARCATAWRLSSGVTLVSLRGCRTKGLPMAKGGVVKSLCLFSEGSGESITRTHNSTQKTAHLVCEPGGIISPKHLFPEHHD